MKYKGYELLKAIADGEIKEGTKFIIKDFSNNKIIYFNGNDLWCENNGAPVFDTMYLINFLNYTFELIEDEIDIDSIEDYKQEHTERCIDVDTRNKINELVRAVKQLNKKVKELKEKMYNENDNL